MVNPGTPGVLPGESPSPPTTRTSQGYSESRLGNWMIQLGSRVMLRRTGLENHERRIGTSRGWAIAPIYCLSSFRIPPVEQGRRKG